MEEDNKDNENNNNCSCSCQRQREWAYKVCLQFYFILIVYLTYIQTTGGGESPPFQCQGLCPPSFTPISTPGYAHPLYCVLSHRGLVHPTSPSVAFRAMMRPSSNPNEALGPSPLSTQRDKEGHT